MLARLAHLSKEALVYGLGGVAVRLTGFIFLPIYTRVFPDTATYGVLQNVNNLGALLLAVAVLGLDGATSIVFFATDSPVERQRISTMWVVVSLLFAAPMTLLLIPLAPQVSMLATGSSAAAPLFAVGMAVLPFNLLQVVISHVLRMYFRPRAYALLNIVLTFLVLVVSLYLLLGLHIGVYSAVWGTLIGTAVATLAGLWLIRDVVNLRLVDSHAWRLTFKMLKLGAPLVPASIALWVISFSNTYFLTRLSDLGAVGVFRVGAQLAAILGLAVWAFQLAWLPYSLSIAREPDAPQVYARVATLYTAGSVGACVLLAGLAPVLLLLPGGKYEGASSVIGLLALAGAALGSYYVVAIGVNVAHRTGQIGWTTIVAAVANLTLNALLIPVWGIVGAGLASLGANLFSAVLVYKASQRAYPLPYEPGRMLIIWLVGSACVAASAIFDVAVHPSIPVAVLTALLLFAVYTVVLFASGSVTTGQFAAVRAAVSGAVGKRLAR